MSRFQHFKKESRDVLLLPQLRVHSRFEPMTVDRRAVERVEVVMGLSWSASISGAGFEGRGIQLNENHLEAGSELGRQPIFILCRGN